MCCIWASLQAELFWVVDAVLLWSHFLLIAHVVMVWNGSFVHLYIKVAIDWITMQTTCYECPRLGLHDVCRCLKWPQRSKILLNKILPEYIYTDAQREKTKVISKLIYKTVYRRRLIAVVPAEGGPNSY